MATTAQIKNNKTTARRWIEEVWNKGNLAAADEILDPKVVVHDSSETGTKRGIKSRKDLVAKIREQFDLKFKVNDVIAEGNKVTILWSATGRHRGGFAGLAAKGQAVSIAGAEALTFSRGKITQVVSHWDEAKLNRQLNV
jgi:steroid delta-isomerase-like uncharacterized protein